MVLVSVALNATRSGNELGLTWTAASTGFVLQSATTLANSPPPQTSATVVHVSADTVTSVTIIVAHNQAGSNPSTTYFFCKSNLSSVSWPVARERIFMLSN